MIDRDEMVQQVFLLIMKGSIDHAVAGQRGFADQLENDMVETYKAAAVRVVSVFWGDEQ